MDCRYATRTNKHWDEDLPFCLSHLAREPHLDSLPLPAEFRRRQPRFSAQHRVPPLIHEIQEIQDLPHRSSRDDLRIR